MRFENMCRYSFKRIDRNKVVILFPLGACEQHGDHLPTMTDTILVSTIADRTEDLLRDEVLLLPTAWWGVSREHLPLGATLSASEETHMGMIQEICVNLLNDGFKRFMVLNGHGGNWATVGTALNRLQSQFHHALFAHASYWQIAATDFSRIVTGPMKTIGHACEIETSMMLAIRPDLVDMNYAQNGQEISLESPSGLYIDADFTYKTKNGILGYPENATVEKGHQLCDAAVKATVNSLQFLLDHAFTSYV